MQGIRWERLASIIFCTLIFVLLGYAGVRYLFPCLLPFLIAWGMARLLRPLAKRISNRVPLPEGVIGCVLLLLAWVALVGLLGLSIRRLLSELENLLQTWLAEDGPLWQAVTNPIDYFEWLTERVGFLGKLGASEGAERFRVGFNRAVGDFLSGLTDTLSAWLPTFLGDVIAALPNLFLLLTVTVISGFYFCLDDGRIARGIRSVLPQAMVKSLPRWRARAVRVCAQYAKAYLLLLLLTFSELFLGFLILGVDYAILSALAIALVDLLPILGVGTVLVPWAVIAFVRHNVFLGMGLLVLYAVILILRQIAEPRLIGQSLGLHPLLTLLATYIGFRLFGFAGMLLAPFVALLCRVILRTGAGILSKSDEKI